MRTLICLTSLLLACAPAWAAQVYKWKDANGVTQYSATPPPGKAYETRPLTRDPGTAPAAAAAATGSEPAQCTTARENLALLDRTGPVLQDADGDGTAETALTDEQRSSQRALAEAAIKAWCPGAA